MTKKDKKRTGAHSEPAKGPAVKDGGEDNSSAMADASRIHAKEVFDSSKYNAMSDMTKASNRETKIAETLPDTKRITNSVNPEQIDDNNNNKSITTTAATASASASASLSGVEEEEEEITPKITPMMVEERARTIREVKEEETHQHLSPSTSSTSSSLSYQTRKEKKFVLYLNIMLSIENAAIERLHARIQQSPLAEVREQLVQHLEETREQKAG
jgi:hypothetical protein